MNYKLKPLAIPIPPKNHILAAVVNLTTFLYQISSEFFLSNNSPFNIIPALGSPISVMIRVGILDVELGETSAEMDVILLNLLSQSNEFLSVLPSLLTISVPIEKRGH